MQFREYDSTRDLEAIQRIWHETGWLKEGQEERAQIEMEENYALVAELEGATEAMAATLAGTVRYLDEELPFSGVVAVSTSRVARKLGLARRLTALLVAADANRGALVSGLTMFEQGFYNRLGFGTGSYERMISFDPAQLNVRTRARVPRRLSRDDWAAVHASRLQRAHGHGSVSLFYPSLTRSEMINTPNGFGLGYYDGPAGELTHHLWCGAEDVERGPYFIPWLTFQTPEQFLELMALIRGLGDQVRLVRMAEPQGIQVQDLLLHPFRHRTTTRNSQFETGIRASAYWQMRICDLLGCLARTHLDRTPLRFNLQLSDPITAVLDETEAPTVQMGGWKGVAGEYVITLGPESAAERRIDPKLPTLAASVGAFTRMWLGACPASGLAVTDQLTGPAELLKQLDCTLCLPEPSLGWEF